MIREVLTDVLLALAVVTVAALVFMVIAAPFLSHATMRAIRVRAEGDWRGRRPAKDTEHTEDTEDRPRDHPADQPSDGAPARRSR